MTSFVNGIITNWVSVIPLIQPIVNSGSATADFICSNSSNKWCSSALKIVANGFIKVIATGTAFTVNDVRGYLGKPIQETASFRKKNKTYLALGGVQFLLNLGSFATDILSYYNKVNNDNDCALITTCPIILTSDEFANLSLFLAGLGVAILAGRELIYKNSAEAENQTRAALANGLSAALENVDPKIILTISEKDLKKTLRKVVPKKVAEKASSIKSATMVEPAAPKTTMVVEKLAEALIKIPSNELALALCTIANEHSFNIKDSSKNLLAATLVVKELLQKEKPIELGWFQKDIKPLFASLKANKLTIFEIIVELLGSQKIKNLQSHINETMQLKAAKAILFAEALANTKKELLKSVIMLEKQEAIKMILVAALVNFTKMGQSLTATRSDIPVALSKTAENKIKQFVPSTLPPDYRHTYNF